MRPALWLLVTHGYIFYEILGFFVWILALTSREYESSSWWPQNAKLKASKQVHKAACDRISYDDT